MTIQEILNEHRIDYKEVGQHHHARPGWIQIRTCPFCNSDNYHLGWNTQINYAACWKCGGHRADKTLEALGIGRDEARQLLRYVEPDQGVKRERTRSVLEEPAGRGPLGKAHKAYLRQRGFDPDQIVKLWEVEGIGVSARLGWRLYLPIIQQGKRVSWTTRAIGPNVSQRYISASAKQEVINHKHCIYGMDHCSHSIVIVEGPLDAWAIGPGGGALFGTAFTPAQVKKLLAIPRRFICFDSSKDAQHKAADLADQLAVFPGVTTNILIDAKDPGEAKPKEIRMIRKLAGL